MRKHFLIKTIEDSITSENALQNHFWQEAMKNSSIYKKIRLVNCHIDITKEMEVHSERIDGQFAIVIQNALKKSHFSSFNSFSHDLGFSLKTIYE